MFKRALFATMLWLLSSPLLFADGFNREIFGSIQVDRAIGKATTSGETKKIKQNIIKAEIGYGVFLGPILEPFIELATLTESNEIGAFKSNSTHTQWGLGLLFNMIDEERKGNGKRRFESGISPWIPYGGFLVSAKRGSSSGEDTILTELTKNTVTTKLTLGIRYLLLANVATNSWIRVSYEKTADTALGTNEENVGVDKFTVEVQVIALSFLF